MTQHPRDPAEPPGPRVLLVDDTPRVRAALSDFLRMMGVEVVGEAGDGAAGVAAARELVPDVVVMDWKMPGMDGIQATRLIVGLGLGIQVVMLSAYASPATEELSRAAGAVRLLAKGDHPTLLVAAIQQAWGARPLQRPG
jgi:CheY-like chemotaxis protein